MDYFSERLRKHLEMDKFSTEIISKSYSGYSIQNYGRIYENIEHYYMAEDGSEAEIYNVESGNSKRNISNDTTAHLSAQVMNLPYNKFNESIYNEVPEGPKKSIYDEYDIFKKIREAYAACACKICKCLTGASITPGIEFCDCEPCKCRECTLNNNLSINSANFPPSLGTKTCNRMDHIKSEIKSTRCDCTPCGCIECSEQCRLLNSDFSLENKTKEEVRKRATMSLEQNNPQDYNLTRDISIGINKLTNCKRTTRLNDAYEAEKTKSSQWTPRGETPSKQIEINAKGSVNSTMLQNKRSETIYQAHSNKKCVCSVCECIVCECNENALTCTLDATPYNIKARNVGLANSKFNRAPSYSMKHTECKCEICSCEQCERDPKWKNQDCNCDHGCCDESGSKIPGNVLYLIKKQLSISRILRESPYEQLLKSRTQSNLMRTLTPEKTKHGNIYFVSNDKTYENTHRILSQDQSTMTEKIKLDRTVQKDIHRNVDSKRRQRKLNQVDNEMKTTTRRPNSRTSKKFVKDVAVSVLPPTLCKGVPSTYPPKSCLRSFNPGCRSTQTISKSSTLISCQNNGCCTHTISLPDTNIVDDFTITTPELRSYENQKDSYLKQHDIYVCCEIKNDFNKTNAAKIVRIDQNNNDDRKNIVENFLLDTFDKYLSKSCTVEKTKHTKVDHETVHTTLRKAKQFTVYLNKILQKYEKANSEFESVSDKLKKSHYNMFNKANKNLNSQACVSVNSSRSICNNRQIETKPNKSFLTNNHKCNTITKHAAAIEVKNYTCKSCKENETVVQRSEIVKPPGIFKRNKQKKTVTILQPCTNALNKNAKQAEKDKETEKISQNTDKIKESCNTNSVLSQDAIKEYEHAAVEMEPKDHFTFNYHTKSLTRSTVLSVF